MLSDRPKTPAEKKKIVRSPQKIKSPPNYYFAIHIPKSLLLLLFPADLSASKQSESTMAGQDKKRSKKAGGAKGEAGKVISTFTILCAE